MSSPALNATRRVICTLLCGAIFCALALIETPAYAAVEDRKWIEINSPNFTIAGPIGKREGREMARYVELLRASILLLLNFDDTAPHIPTQVYVLPKLAFRDLGDMQFIGAVYLPGTRRNLFVIRDNSGPKRSMIQHEFVHFLTESQDSFQYPLWYVEGLAQYFDTAYERFGYFHVGELPVWCEPYLRSHSLLGAQDFLNAGGLASRDDRDDFFMFYAQSRLLVHYLFHSKSRNFDLKSAFTEYADSRATGRDGMESFSSAFSLPADDLRKALYSYLNSECCGKLRFPVDELLPKLRTEIRTLSRAEASLALARIGVHFPDATRLETWLDNALAEPSTRPEALSISTRLLLDRHEFDGAARRLQEAVELAPDDPVVHLDHARYRLALAGMADDPEEIEGHLGEAASHLLAAWERDPSIPEVYALIGETYLMQGDQPARAVEMLEQASLLLPANFRIKLLLTNAYAADGSFEQGLRLARSMQHSLHEGQDEKAAVLELIERMEERVADRD